MSCLHSKTTHSYIVNSAESCNVFVTWWQHREWTDRQTDAQWTNKHHCIRSVASTLLRTDWCYVVLLYSIHKWHPHKIRYHTLCKSTLLQLAAWTCQWTWSHRHQRISNARFLSRCHQWLDIRLPAWYFNS